MPSYIVEQYEIRIVKYHVQADNVVEAIQKSLNGEGGSEVGSDFYQNFDPELDNRNVSEDLSIEEMNKLGWGFLQRVPGVRSVKEV